MADIGGNIYGVIQTKTTAGYNEIGEPDIIWSNAFTDVLGWLGLQNGDNKRTYNAKIEESTHVFLCDYNSGIYDLAEQDTRMVIKGKMYDVTFIDNPDEMDEHLEIYLRKIGGQNV